MRILERSELRLVIKDGSSWHNLFPIHNLVSKKWHRAIDIASGLGLIAIGILWWQGKIPPNLSLPIKFLCFLLAAPLILTFMTGQYQDPPIYILDKSTGQLVIHHHGKTLQTHALDDIIDVISISTDNDDPPPSYWRTIQLKLRSDIDLELHPGHDEPEKQQEMVTVLRKFLNLDES